MLLNLCDKNITTNIQQRIGFGKMLMKLSWYFGGSDSNGNLGRYSVILIHRINLTTFWVFCSKKNGSYLFAAVLDISVKWDFREKLFSY